MTPHHRPRRRRPTTRTAVRPRKRPPKVQAAEDAWNTRTRCAAGVHTADSVWRNRPSSSTDEKIDAFLTAKRQTRQEYALRKSLWAFGADRIAVRFQYEWHDENGQWWRSYGNENWEFDPPDDCPAARPASTTSPSPPTNAASSAPGPPA